MADQPEASPASPRRSRRASSSSIVEQRQIISIIDRTRPSEDSASSRPSSPDAGPSTFRGKKKSWKYARFTEDRAATIGEEGEGLNLSDSKYGQNPLHRRRAQLHDKIHKLDHKSQQADGDAEIDVLYENQRGAFFCGMPLFSGRALNPLDPAPWVDGNFHRSREDITNAQVPDPSWEWAWRTWYVDMSRDVDEEGWEYSFYFKGCSWHGVHPWFHSFVRRRKWIRKRVRKASRPAGDPHFMAQDYFTIHSGRVTSLTSEPTSPVSDKQSKRVSKQWGKEDKEPWEEQDVQDIGTLLQALKAAPVDSERIVLIRTFIDKNSDDLYCLADEIPKIMSFFFHEHSSRRLLTVLTTKIHDANERREEHEQRDKAEDPREKRYIEALLKAADVVDEQCKKLEFWSDVRGLTRHGQTMTATGDDSKWTHEWAGLDQSGPENWRSPPTTKEHERNDDGSEASDGAQSQLNKGKHVLRPEGYSIDSSIVSDPMDNLDVSFSGTTASKALTESSMLPGPEARRLDDDEEEEEDTESSTIHSAQGIKGEQKHSEDTEQPSESQYDTAASTAETRGSSSFDRSSSQEAEAAKS